MTWFWIVWGLLLMATAILMYIQVQYGESLKSDITPSGIVDFELARTRDRAEQILDAWKERQTQEHAVKGLMWDFGFLLTYGACLALGCVLTPRLWGYGHPWLASQGAKLAWVAGFAALCDALENTCLLYQLRRGARSLAAALAYMASVLKFIAAVVCLLYIAAGFAARPLGWLLGALAGLVADPRVRVPITLALFVALLIRVVLLSRSRQGESARLRMARLARYRLWVLAGSVAFWCVNYGAGDISGLGGGLLSRALVWAYEYPLFSAIGLLLVMAVYNLIGRGLGLYRLFLNEKPWPRFFSAVGVAVVTGQLMAATFFLEPRFHVYADQRIVGGDSVYRTVADFLKMPLVSVFHADAEGMRLTYKHRVSQGDDGLRYDDHNGGKNELTVHIGRMNLETDPEDARRGVLPGPPPEDFAWRWLTFTLVTAAPIWFTLWLPSLPILAFEGLRFTDPSSQAEQVPADLALKSVELTPEPAGPAIQPYLTKDWFSRFFFWSSGLVVGIFFLAFQIWVGIPLTYGLSSLTQWWEGTAVHTVGSGAGEVYWYAAAVFTIIGLATFAVLRYTWLYQIVSPGLAICAMFWVIIIAYSLYCLPISLVKLGFFGPAWNYARFLIPLALLAYIGWSNGSWYKLTIPGLVSGKRARLSYEEIGRAQRKLGEFTIPGPKSGQPNAVEAAGHEKILDAWLEQLPGALDKSRRAKMVIVCVSGGALRSAIWTGVVLDAIRQRFSELETPIEFDPHVRLICGASGGMLGTSAYLARRLQSLRTGKPDETPLSQTLHNDQLSEVARRFALHDIPSILDWRVQVDDRGRALEDCWREILPDTFGMMKKFEKEGKLPSIIFSPMFVEDGRRLLISNLDLEFLTRTAGPILQDPESERKYGQNVSQGALELEAIFPEEFPNFLVRTAVRLNASFPYVSPAVSLPTDPPRRPVDAGYYDNFGVNLACRWIHKHRVWIQTNAVDVLLLQIRDHMGQLDRFEFSDAGSTVGVLGKGLSFLTAPLAGASKARYATTSFRNDEEIHALNSMFDPTRSSLKTIVFEFQNDGEVALNWQLSGDEVRQLEAGIKNPKNDEALAEFVRWWL